MVVRKNKERKPMPPAAKTGLLGELSADVLRVFPASEPGPGRASAPARLPPNPGADVPPSVDRAPGH